jgi:hypothetical protein
LKQGSKRFFFEKKQQKTSISWGGGNSGVSVAGMTRSGDRRAAAGSLN